MKLLPHIFILLLLYSCTNKHTQQQRAANEEIAAIECNEHGCHGTYEGAEFINGDDIAHQFSNKMSHAVGNELKKQYRQQHYKKVNFDSITMTTKGMGSSRVTYVLSVPFIAVGTACEAYTSFDHCGGWNHEPDLARRKNELKDVTLRGHQLEISTLKTTTEGLQEYWIQWKNKDVQKVASKHGKRFWAVARRSIFLYQCSLHLIRQKIKIAQGKKLSNSKI